jgi:acetylglutamate kinase
VKIVVKYGGSAMGAGVDGAVLSDLAELRAAGHAVILVHGGGPEIDRALAGRGLRPPRVDGLRVTDAAALEVVEATLCASANKRLVRACLQCGIPAVGLSGQDGGMLRAKRLQPPAGTDLGFVGEIVCVDVRPLEALLAAGYLPVVAPMALDVSAAQAYNVNADSAAGAIAAAVRADAFVALTNVDRVLRDPADPSSAVPFFSVAQAAHFAASGACRTGMKPKLLAAIGAVTGGANRAYICGVKPGAIFGALAGEATVIA